MNDATDAATAGVRRRRPEREGDGRSEKSGRRKLWTGSFSLAVKRSARARPHAVTAFIAHDPGVDVG